MVRGLSFDWPSFQEKYDSGSTIKSLMVEFGYSRKSVTTASKKGLFVSSGNPGPRPIRTKLDSTDGCQQCGIDRKSKYSRFCSTVCSSENSRLRVIASWLSGKDDGTGKNGELRKPFRDYLLAEADYTCQGEGCYVRKFNSFSGKPIVQIDHIDGDSSNNQRKNLRVLCPNCHAMTSTFGGLNHGNGRELRRRSRSTIQSGCNSGVECDLAEIEATGSIPVTRSELCSNAPVAQLDRASDYESGGRTFESSRAHHRQSEGGTGIMDWVFVETHDDG
jgi:hypothetical protein